jgi:4-amino-4-deoxy-L-arabinose transferase-like glycosyltransferase
MPACAAALLLFALAFVPRSLNLDQHATADEDLTLIRSANVAMSLEGRDWWGTYQVGHPEATVQLLVALVLGPDALRPYTGDFLGPDSRLAARVPGYFNALVEARRVLVPVHALLIVVSALLAWRLWSPTIGLLTGLLLALEPFLVAHGRILRTDALLAELMLVAVLAALAYWSTRAGVWALLVCAVATGLALLTKTPALALLGAIPVAALVSHLTATADARTPSAIASRRTAGLLVSLIAWLVGSAAVVSATWPAMWARPIRAIERMIVYTQEKGGSPMDAGGFFLGSPVADPGPLYYAVALPLRLSPLVLVGLAVWVFLRAPRLRSGVGLVLLTGLGLACVLALLPKKADRYILPAIPFLIVVAAVGIAAGSERWRVLRASVAATGVVAVNTAFLVMVWPYPLAAYDPLVGGAAAAEEWISVGWGEGLDQLAPILNTRPDATFLTVSTAYPEVLQAQIAGRAVDLDAYDVADYVVEYVAASQRRLTTPALAAALAGREPIGRVEIAGSPYAQLYELDRPTFAGNLQVRQLDVSPSVTTRRGWVTVKLAFGPASAEGRMRGPGLTPFVTPYEVEVSLVNSARFDDVEATISRSLLPDGSLAEVKLRAPNGLGRYVVRISARDPSSGARLGIASWPVGTPHQPEHLVFPSLSVRVQ